MRNVQWQPSTTSLLREAGVCDLIAERWNGAHKARSIPDSNKTVEYTTSKGEAYRRTSVRCDGTMLESSKESR